MKAIVLAGGFGTRIQPLTNSVPKPMLPILNRPMMEHIIIKLRDDLGITDIAVLLYFKPEIIKEYFGDGSGWGVKITYVQPDDDYGTAGAVGFARELMDESFIIVSGDLVTDFDFKQIAAFHKQKRSKLTITLTPVDNPLQFGVVIANEEGRIEKFLEKPSWGEVFSDTINTGIYLLEPEIFDYIPVEENFDFAKDLFPTLMKEGVTLWGCSVEGYWRDVGNPQSYREVYQDLFDEETVLPMKGEKSEQGGCAIYREDGTGLPESVRCSGTVVLGKNVTIGKDVELGNVAIGDNVKIGEGCRIKESIIWNDVEIEGKVTLHNSVICNNNRIAKKVKAKNGVIISEYCEVDKGTIFTKDVIVWPEKSINEGSIVSNNIIWGKNYKSSLFESGKVIGRTNVELSCEMATKLAESFGSILPVGSKVYISRDYHRSSRMLKRAFLSGMLSTGIDVLDLRNIPSNVMRFTLAHHEEVAAGIHFRQSTINQLDTEIIFYTSEGLAIDTNLSKNVERIFFRENFRRVNHTQIGEIDEEHHVKDRYVEVLQQRLDSALFKSSEMKVAVDIMFGSTSDIYPKILNELQIENIVLNGYQDDKRLTKLPSLIKSSHKNIADIVKTMQLNCGFLIYPNGQKVQMVSDTGELVYDYTALLVVLSLLNESKEGAKVFLPAWAPDYIEFENLEITRGKIESLKARQLEEYDLIATTDGHFAFTEFGLNNDAIFASLKILELLLKNDTKVSDVVENLPVFCFKGENIPCPSERKGLMMRKFLEDGKDKKTAFDDGVKIWVEEDEWILMVPDQHSEFLNIYLQAKDESRANEIFYSYKSKIEKW